MSQVSKIKGFTDLFGPDLASFRRLEAAASNVFGRYGFSELRLPVLERTELFCRAIGEATDVVQKEMYTFPDRKGRSLTMRPEATAGMVRAVIENNLLSDGGVKKLWFCGPMFRYERPQKGRLRQFHQVDVEAFGSDSPHLDAELIVMLTDMLASVGVTQIRLDVNSLGCPECRPQYLEALKDFFRNVTDEELCEDCRKRREVNPLRLLDCKSAGCKELAKNAPSILDHLCPGCKSHHDVVLKSLTKAGVPFVQNPKLVRGLDYYVKTTFEVVAEDPRVGAQASIAGGGRYDGLVKTLGGPDVPAVGFGIGMERVALLMEPQGPARVDFAVCPLAEAALDPSFDLALALRRAGLAGECAFAAKSPKALLRAADKIGARFALLLGEDELAKASVMVKDLQLKTQDLHPLVDAPKVLLAALKA